MITRASTQRLAAEIERRRQAEQALQESEERFQLLSEASFEGIMIHDKGCILEANQTFARIFGYQPAELIGKSVLDLASTKSRDEVQSKVLSGFDQGYEGLGLRKDGSTFPAEIRGRTIEYKGRAVRITAIRDLSQQKCAEQALRESEEKYRTVIENATDAIFVAQDEVIKFPNPKTLEITGYTEEELAVTPFVELIHPEDRELVMKRHLQRLSGEDLQQTYSFRIFNKRGDILWAQLNTILLDWEGRPATLNFIRDVTEQKQLETQLQQAQKIEALGTLTGGIAHDFNNILAIILGYTEIAEVQLPPANPARKALAEVKAASLRAKGIVSQLLTFTRAKDEAQVRIDIKPVIKEGLKMLRSSLPAGIILQEEMADELQPVQANINQIHQILINLCTNAAQAMQNQGEIRVTLENVSLQGPLQTVDHVLPAGDYVRFSISDTGRGIAEQDLERIFDPYFTTKEVGQGSGLGLSVILGIVRGHRGGVTVHSEVNRGSTFALLLPALRRAQEAGHVPCSEELPGGSEHILFIDDNEKIVDLNQERLRRLGYEVTGSIDPEQALHWIGEQPQRFDLVITDLTMPKLTGDRLAGEILQLRSDLPVILCSGRSPSMQSQEAHEVAISRYLEKPLDIETLARAVREVLDGRD